MDSITLSYFEFNLIQSGFGFVEEFYNQLPKHPDKSRRELYEHLETVHEKITTKRRYVNYYSFSVVYSRWLKIKHC